MNRYVLEAFIDNTLIFYREFRSITSVAKTIDNFSNCKECDIWFDLYDVINDRSINVKELMTIWHG